jgi:hypothetical protein
MIDHPAELRHEIAHARMATLRRSAEPVGTGRLGRTFDITAARVRPRLAFLGVVAIGVVVALAVAGRAAAFPDQPESDARADRAHIEGASGPEQLALTFVGGHGAPSVSDLGMRYEGTFTASAPFCPAGSAADVQQYPFAIVAVRSLTCTDGSGGVVLRIGPRTGEESLGGTGTWTIVDGTGRFAGLRGTGKWLVGGEDLAAGRPMFRMALSGVAAFDVGAPRIAFARSSVTSGKRDWMVRYTFSAADDVASNRVSYRVAVLTNGRLLGMRDGTTAAARPVSLGQRAPRGVRNVTVVLTAIDPLGNTSRLVRLVHIPSRA